MYMRVLFSALLIGGCNASNQCRELVIYDAVDGNVSEIINLNSATVYIVSKGTAVDKTTSSEVGGSLIVGRSSHAIWFDWPLGFAMSKGPDLFETPDMMCRTTKLGKDRTKTTCTSKNDGSVWLEYITDVRGVYEFKRHTGEYQFTMRRRGTCSLSLDAMKRLRSSNRE